MKGERHAPLQIPPMKGARHAPLQIPSMTRKLQK